MGGLANEAAGEMVDGVLAGSRPERSLRGINCQHIAATEPVADMVVLKPAAFFHDLVNLPKSSPVCSSRFCSPS